MSAGKVPPQPPALPVLGSSRGRFRLELDTTSGDAAIDPFLPLEDSGRLARLLLGRFSTAEGASVRALAVKIQKASAAAGTPGPGQDPVTNAQIDELWRRERENLRALQNEAGPGLVDVGDAAFRNLPLVFCRKTSLTFHPPCPTCLGPLGDCRDDALLREAGLPEYSTSASRYLHCAACGAKVFYSGAATADERPRADVTVRRRGELYRDLGRAARAGKGDAEAFPCLACPHRDECYPAAAAADSPIPAETRLAPVSFHDFHMLLLEPMELGFDEACDLAGGAPWAEVRARAARGGAGRDRLFAALDARLDSPFQWLYRGDTLGRFALEVLLLKLSLFLQAAGELRAFHRSCRQPHLDLSPKSVGVSVAAAGTALPARWGFRARLAVASGPRRLFPAASAPEAARELWAPSPDADKSHLSPFVREAAPGQVESLRVALLDGTRGLILPDRARLDLWRARDVVRIVPSAGAGPLEGATLWATLEARSDKGFPFVAELPADVKPSEFQAAVAHYPRFQSPCDLYGLGLLLLRALAANDENDAFAVEDATQRILKKFAVALEGKGATSARRAAVELGMLLDEERAVFGPAAPLRRREDRARKGNALPSRLWGDVLLLAFKLVTRVPGFSFAVDHADVPPDRPEAPLEAVVAEAEALRARVSVELFGREQRDGEIHDACAELLGKLAGKGGA
ncbi:MAG TPA: hypothetical protein VF950_22740 [Planctomycetota bacterium]